MSLTPISLELRFLRIPATWSRRKDRMYGDFALVPELKPGPAKPIEDAWSLRNEFLRMEHSEEAALKFLEKVGVWDVGYSAPWSEAKCLSSAIGHRVITPPRYPLPVTIEELWDEQERWDQMLKEKNRAKLKAVFGPPPKEDALPHDHITFAWNTHFANTLQTHLESKPMPHAVIQPITGRELLIALAWVDLVGGYESQVCQNCGIPFTSKRKRMFCPPTQEYAITSPCAHAAAQRSYRIREGKRKKRHREISNSPKNKPKKKSSR
jgi:hypothetical protein